MLPFVRWTSAGADPGQQGVLRAAYNAIRGTASFYNRDCLSQR